MSIAAKQMMLKDFEKQLGNKLTVDNVATVIDVLADVLTDYELETSENFNGCLESEELVTAFLEAKTIEGCSPKTIARYKYILGRLLEDINVPVRKVSVFHLRHHLMDKRSKGLSESTVEGLRSIYSSFFGWLLKEELIKTNPCANINPIKCAKKVRKPFSAVELERLKEACTSIRDKALINFLLSTGCRISEICELDRDSVDFQNMECKVHGKGNKERVVFIDSVTAMLLRRYLMQRVDTKPALFVGKGTDRITPQGVRAMLSKLAVKAGVENVHPHRFRRTLATNLIDHGMPIQEVASILGHDNIDTTMTYVYIDKTNVKNSYRKYA